MELMCVYTLCEADWWLRQHCCPICHHKWWGRVMHRLFNTLL